MPAEVPGVGEVSGLEEGRAQSIQRRKATKRPSQPEKDIEIQST